MLAPVHLCAVLQKRATATTMYYILPCTTMYCDSTSMYVHVYTPVCSSTAGASGTPLYAHRLGRRYVRVPERPADPRFFEKCVDLDIKRVESRREEKRGGERRGDQRRPTAPLPSVCARVAAAARTTESRKIGNRTRRLRIDGIARVRSLFTRHRRQLRTGEAACLR